MILASLVEKEANLDFEQPVVAGVLINRLKRGMRLQVDPTVNYGLNYPFARPLTKKDLKKKTPYNTYRIKGLPPTPICLPGLSAIDAVLHPAKVAYLYYVAKGDGSHHFSKTYSDHNKAVKKYQIDGDKVHGTQ